jgi:hypothetical protein
MLTPTVPIASAWAMRNSTRVWFSLNHDLIGSVITHYPVRNVIPSARTMAAAVMTTTMTIS